MEYPKAVVASAGERESVVDRLPFDFPIVVKPENSNALDYLRCHFEGQKKVFFFDAREQYLTMVHSMNQSDYRGKLILQEFIPGGDDAMRVLNSYSDLDGHVRAMCLGQPVLEYYDPKSVGNYAAIISRGDQALYDKMQEFLEKLGYVGFSNIDMKYDSRTGRYVLFEINPRLGRSSYFCRAAGLNMMKLLTNDVVYGKREDCIYNHTVALWQNVPTGILRRYVKDQELSDELKQFKGTQFQRREQVVRHFGVLFHQCGAPPHGQVVVGAEVFFQQFAVDPGATRFVGPCRQLVTDGEQAFVQLHRDGNLPVGDAAFVPYRHQCLGRHALRQFRFVQQDECSHRKPF